MGTLNEILASDSLPAATLAFRYWLYAIAHGYPAPLPGHVNLAGADLEEWTICGHSPDQPLRLRGANLEGAKLNRARLENVDLSTANLNRLEARQALFLNVAAAHADLSHSDLCGLQWRVGTLAEAKLADAKISGTQWIDVDLTGAALPENWDEIAASVERDRQITFPIVQQRATQLVALVVDSDFAVASASSSDDRQIPSVSDDGTGNTRAAETGECLSTSVRLPDGQTAVLDLADNCVLAASPEAWRFLGWRWKDPRTGRLRILPAEFFGPLPTGKPVITGPAAQSRAEEAR